MSQPALDERLQNAIRRFWMTRDDAQMNGFVTLVQELLDERKVPSHHVYSDSYVEPPGWYRPEKKWNLLVVADGRLQAGIEFESQVGSFGGSNWTEEALGSASDVWAAYREGAFKPTRAPWLGYLMVLEEAPGSVSPVRGRASYAKRCETLLTKFVRECHYNGACLLMSNREDGRRGLYSEPAPELGFQNFINSLLGRVTVIS